MDAVSNSFFRLGLEEASKLVDEVNFAKGNGLVPVVVQDLATGQVLMQAFMDKEALLKTLTTGLMHYWSRSRGKLWLKGETSGHYQYVKEVYLDCDRDALLFKVVQVGVCCHEGFYTCFHNKVEAKVKEEVAKGPAILAEVFEVIKDRLRSPKPTSYVSSLASAGVNAVSRKVGEEALELVLAAKDNAKEEVVKEAADLLFHSLVLLAVLGVDLDEVFRELEARRRAGRLKEASGKPSPAPS